MKKFFLIATILFTLGSFSEIKAKNEHETLTPKEPLSCFEQAWEFGTDMGQGDRAKEYYHMNRFYMEFCK